ncbi:hypothetical protein CXB51_015782 [Gossypium anomalum]|uniref:Uncharacterized protein n=1 Tax=Gossypium anomalum TaxID=47600 RepID=A0A8J5YUC5_9ROSI|nr:hypothetical protein CXB51_015782 [Gossypium anomalum]
MRLEFEIFLILENLQDNQNKENMAVKPTVVLRAFLVGGVAIFAKVGGAMKAAGSAKLGAAAAAMTMAASAAMSKQDQKVVTKLPSK